jgi:S1-C subfamily serine protease
VIAPRGSDLDLASDLFDRANGRRTIEQRGTIAFRRRSVAARLFALMLFATTLTAPASARGAAAAVEAERLVFLLQYVGADYGLAVQAGQATNAFEYAEMLTLTHELEEGYAQLRGDEGSVLVRQGLERLHHLVEHRVAWEEVRTLVRELTPRLAEDLGVSVAPVGPLDAGRGGELYEVSCAPCHGADGAGSGPAAAGMDPPPTSFLDARMAYLSPHQIVGAVRFGLLGTPMPSFDGAFSPEDLWNLATYVWSLRGATTRKEPQGTAGMPPAAAPGVPGLAPALELEAAFAAIADLVFPSVASVGAWVAVEPASEASPGDAAGWREAGPRDDPHPGFRLARARSGFFIGDDGFLLTNAGAVEPVDGREVAIVDVEIDDLHYRARVVGVEPTVDIALLKVELPFATRPVQLAAEDSVRVGRWAIALGDPPGPERTFSTGTIASRPERLCYQEQRAATLVQTSCRLDPESYGGPVVDISGRVFGITVPRPGGEGPAALAAFSFARQAQALPIGLALTLADAMKARESSRSPWLGFSVLELTRQTRNRRSPRTGVFIDDVFEPSPASRAGIRVGDVLVAIDANRVLSVPDFQKWLYLAGIGAKVTLHLSRNGEEIALPMVIEERPAEAMPSDPTSSRHPR